jgi:hypothetical protein
MSTLRRERYYGESTLYSRMNLNVDNFDGFFKLRETGDDLAIRVNNERRPVKDEFVLTPYLVDVHDRNFVFAGSLDDRSDTLGIFAALVGRSVD